MPNTFKNQRNREIRKNAHCAFLQDEIVGRLYPYISKQLAFNLSNQVHSYTIQYKYSTPYLTMYARNINGRLCDPWNRTRKIPCKHVHCKTIYSNDEHRHRILVSITRPTIRNKQPNGIIVYAHGKSHDLGMLHRPVDNEIFYYIHKTQGSRANEERLLAEPDHNNKPSFLQKLANASRCIIVAFEYPGYGYDTCNDKDITKPSEYLCHVLKWVTTKYKLPIIVHGFSVGAAIVVRALYQLKYILRDSTSCNRIIGLILDSCFVSMTEVTPDTIFTKYMFAAVKSLGLITPFYTIKDILPSLDVPISFIHSRRDELCPLWKAKKYLFNKYPHVFSISIINATHNSILTSPKFVREYKKIIRLHLNRHTHNPGNAIG
jgi:pimeloyl-ACP methyl ester carboxylesterase